ncbi:LPD1 domain-containing protein [Marinobacter sp. tcs-11]|uniref:LPD1 domain-containing protein n=1 Tax=Marinobacter sp. tcs-11 TaxID=1742860 RepID=UPI0025801B3C|nr:LPD1 domain-containing protein [Marinobacter sp. tcs-11]
MATQADLKTIWQPSWGILPDGDGTLAVEFDTSKPPALWPDDRKAQGFVVAPLLNGGLWLALIKVQAPGALNELQVQALEAVGFRKGSNGRLICPSYPSPRMVDMMGKILRLPLDTLPAERVAILKPGDQFKPAVPLEVQAGIRDYWKTRPEVLAEEIEISLAERRNDLNPDLLHLVDGSPTSAGSRGINNPVRLQVWVTQALSGEINAVTETILSLGLQRGMMEYGPYVGDWPEDCQSLFQSLAEFRGESPELEASVLPSMAQPNDDQRPSLQTPVAWMEDNTRVRGIVVGLPEDESELWVVGVDDTAGQPSALPFYFPRRIKVKASDIVDPAPQVSESQKPEPTNLAEQALFGEHAQEEHHQAFLPQPKITLADLPNRLLAQRERSGLLKSSLVSDVQLFARSGGNIGQHPLLVPPGESRVDLMASWRHLSGEFYKYPDNDRAILEAEVIARDALIEEFNSAQPETIGGVQSAFAVLPAGHYVAADPGSDTEMREAIEALEYCRVGFHPLLLPKINDRLNDWMNQYSASMRKSNPSLAVELESVALSLKSQSLTLSPCAFNVGSDNLLQSLVRNVYRDIYSDTREELGPDEIERNCALASVRKMRSAEAQAAVMLATEGKLFCTYADAANHINGQSARVAELTERNDAMITAIADLADVSPDTILESNHPILVTLSVIEEASGISASKAELLALLNIDLSERLSWVGQLAAMQGVSIDLAHTTILSEKPSQEDSEALQNLGIPAHIIKNGLPRLSVTSGLLSVGYKRQPFQVGLLATAHNLFKERLKGTSISTGVPTVISDSDRINSNERRAIEALGQLIDLHRVSPITFGSPLEENNQVIRAEAIDQIKPAIYSLQHLNRISASRFSAQAGIGNLEEIMRVDEFVDTAYTQVSEFTAFVEENKQILLTGSPAWRNSDGARRDLEDAMRLFIQDFKPLQQLATPERMANRLIEELANDAKSEMLVVAAKSTGRNVRYFIQVVTKDDLLAANNDRDEAVEVGILNCKKAYPRSRKGFHFAVFDLAKTLRPEAIRYLNELKAKTQRKTGAPTDDEQVTKRRGARQDKGKVAGLAVKDLRGKTSVVLGTLADASASDQKKFITKTKLWEAPDWAFLRAPSEDDRNEGAKPMEPIVAAFFDELRKRLNPTPPANLDYINQMYAKFILGVRDQFDIIRTEQELLDSLKNGEGALAKLYQSISNEADQYGIQAHIILGDDVCSQWIPARKELALSIVHHAAERRSRANKVWDIKEAKPGSGRRPIPRGITQDQEIDADEVEQELTGAMPMLSRLVRKGGEDYRADLDVSEETVIATFGFSGIEYGKSMSQADRTRYLNEAYDGFMDLAKLLDVPPRALSLGGTLGLAFGSRGKGGRRAALAHFEPANNAINLTRMKGAGSMAHEYGHAFANYLFRVSRGVEGSRAPGDITNVMDRQLQSASEVLAGNLREPVAQAIAEVLKSIRYTPVEGDKPKVSLFVSGAIHADNEDGRKPDKRYWATIEELFARAFETYVSVALKEKFPGFRNDFLVRDDKLKTWGFTPHEIREAADKTKDALKAQVAERKASGAESLTGDGYEITRELYRKTRELDRVMARAQLYPAGSELDRIKDAFNKLFKTLETKEKKVHHDHLGEIEMPVLYSSGSGLAERITPRDHAVIAECVLSEVARMCGNSVWVRFQDWITDPLNRKAAGSYSKKTDTEGNLQAVISIAYGAGIHTAHHEAFHYAQDNLLEKSEQTMLDRFFAKDSPLFVRLQQALIDDGRDDALAIIDVDPLEAQAYAYELWVKGKLDVKIEEPPVGVFGKVKSFFDQVASIAKGAGFKTPEQLFQAFYQGKLREREEQKQTARFQTNADSPPINMSPGTHGQTDEKKPERLEVLSQTPSDLSTSGYWSEPEDDIEPGLSM